jgi:hypothetical protein
MMSTVGLSFCKTFNLSALEASFVLCKQGVAGSIPVTSTIFSNRKLAQIFPHADSFQAKFFTCVISSRNEIEFIAKKLNQNSLEHFAEEFLFLRGEFFALGGQIEHIDGFVPFRIDQRDLDIASQPRQR